MKEVPLELPGRLVGRCQFLRRVMPLLAVAGLFLAGGCGPGGSQGQPEPQRPPAQVTVAPALTRDVPLYLDEIGKIVAVEVVSIVPQVSGKLMAAHVQDGDYVEAGQLLFEIDRRPYEAAFASAEATLLQSKADRELSQIEFDRTQGLRITGSASQLEFDQDRVALAVANAKVAWAEAAVQTAQLNLEYTAIRSPIAGRAGARLIDPGNVVRDNDAPLQMIRRLDPIYAEFTITENDLGTVRKYIAAYRLELGEHPERGLRVEVDVPGDSAKVRAALGPLSPATAPGPSRAGPRTGELTFLDNSVQGTTGTVRLRATVANADHYFWPGQFANVRLILATKSNAVLVPAEAQQIGQQGPYVYVITPDRTAELRPIVPGQRQGDLLVVEKGVQGGENVVVAGHMTVMPGAKVQVTNPGSEATDDRLQTGPT